MKVHGIRSQINWPDQELSNQRGDKDPDIHSMVTSRLDNNNSLLYCVPQRDLQKLQMLQNAAARLVTRAPRRCHKSPIFQDLHWLTVF